MIVSRIRFNTISQTPPLKKKKEQSVGRNKHWPRCVYKNGETKKKKTKEKQLRNAIVQKFSSRSLAHARTHEILFHLKKCWEMKGRSGVNGSTMARSIDFRIATNSIFLYLINWITFWSHQKGAGRGESIDFWDARVGGQVDCSCNPAFGRLVIPESKKLRNKRKMSGLERHFLLVSLKTIFIFYFLFLKTHAGRRKILDLQWGGTSLLTRYTKEKKEQKPWGGINEVGIEMASAPLLLHSPSSYSLTLLTPDYFNHVLKIFIVFFSFVFLPLVKIF